MEPPVRLALATDHLQKWVQNTLSDLLPEEISHFGVKLVAQNIIRECQFPAQR